MLFLCLSLAPVSQCHSTISLSCASLDPHTNPPLNMGSSFSSSSVPPDSLRAIDAQLLAAVQRGNHDEIRSLLDAGADLAATSDSHWGNNSLHILMRTQHPNRLPLCDMLLAASPSPKELVNAKNSVGYTPLMMACTSRKPALVEALLKVDGIDVDSANNDQCVDIVGVPPPYCCNLTDICSGIMVPQLHSSPGAGAPRRPRDRRAPPTSQCRHPRSRRQW